jgi:hypothetical protein
MTKDKDKPPWFQQYGSHIDSMPVEHNPPAPEGTRLTSLPLKDQPAPSTSDTGS